MGIMPHTDPNRAMELALGLDVPFWPQLPRYRFMEDMYAQACDGLPGFSIDERGKRVTFSHDAFYHDVEEFYQRIEDPEYFGFRPGSSVVFDHFLNLDLSRFWAIRGQIIGFISLGTKVLDEADKPVIFDPNVKEMLKIATAAKINWQTGKLLAKNPRAFVWIDDPGLPLIFMGTSGYVDSQAKDDLHDMLEKVKGVRGVHLCGNPEWDFLFHAGLDILSLDAFSCGETVILYSSLKKFILRGGVVSWGIVPTQTEIFAEVTEKRLFDFLEGLWDRLGMNGLDKAQIAAQSLLAPATCCLVNPDKDKTVKKTYETLKNLSHKFKQKYGFTS